jgi:3-dehydroquinate synthase
VNIFLYGPPGSGKTTLGRGLAQALGMPFWDLDNQIESRAGKTIVEIFDGEGEASFRQHELAALREAVEKSDTNSYMVIALGGGALVNPAARSVAESNGLVLCLEANVETLLARMAAEEGLRPLLVGNTAERLKRLLRERGEHYHSFPLRLDTTGLAGETLTWQAQLKLGAFHVRGMGPSYDVRIETGGLDRLGMHFKGRGLRGPVALISDRNVGAHYLDQVAGSLRAAGYTVETFCIEPGEANKTIHTVLPVWDFFIRAGIERGSTIAALGGGVVGDLTGFAAATFLRGVPWVNLPTSLLAMVDSSMGGKTGIDLPQAKNLVGAFYPPRLVLADPRVLGTLPERELRNGLAEAIKHGIIADPELFALCEAGLPAVKESLEQLVRQAMAVKLKIIEIDPYEKNLRQALNLGHTIGHGVELSSEFGLSHGEAVAIGTVAEARLAERIGLAEPGLAERIAAAIGRLGLPVAIPSDLSIDKIIQAMRYDKKKAAGKLRYALPVRIGEVRTGVEVENWQELLKQAE